jgi:hypothetical protein
MYINQILDDNQLPCNIRFTCLTRRSDSRGHLELDLRTYIHFFIQHEDPILYEITFNSKYVNPILDDNQPGNIGFTCSRDRSDSRGHLESDLHMQI